jgi:hypothetical protein
MARLSAGLAGLGLAAAVLASGCLDFSGCYGTATWTEPGLSAWLAENRTRPGFNRLDQVPGLDPGPSVAARLPEGAHLQFAVYSDKVGGLARDVWVSPGQVEVSAFTLRAGARTPDAGTMAGFLDGVLRSVHAGGDAAREAAVDSLRRGWPQQEDGGGLEPGHLWWTNLTLDGPWDLGRALPADAGFVPDPESGTMGSSTLAANGWELDSGEPDWIAFWEYKGPLPRSSEVQHRMQVGAHDQVVLDVELLDTGEQVKDVVRGDPRGFTWTFQGFQHDTTCLPGPLF